MHVLTYVLWPSLIATNICLITSKIISSNVLVGFLLLVNCEWQIQNSPESAKKYYKWGKKPGGYSFIR